MFIFFLPRQRLAYSVEKPIADAAKLYWVFLRSEESGVSGALITVMLYTVLFIISSTVLYLYFLRYVFLSHYSRKSLGSGSFSCNIK